MINYYEAINRYNNHNYSCNLLSTLLGRHQVNHYILIVSVNSLQKFYKVGSTASSTFQIRKLWLREAKQIAQGHIYARVHFKVMLVGGPHRPLNSLRLLARRWMFWPLLKNWSQGTPGILTMMRPTGSVFTWVPQSNIVIINQWIISININFQQSKGSFSKSQTSRTLSTSGSAWDRWMWSTNKGSSSDAQNVFSTMASGTRRAFNYMANKVSETTAKTYF